MLSSPVYENLIYGLMRCKLATYSKLQPSSLADPRRAPGTRAPPPSPTGPNSFIFIQFSAKNLQNNTTLGVGVPTQENPGSATAVEKKEHHRDKLAHHSCKL